MFLMVIKDQAPAALCSHKIINLIQSYLFEGVVNTDLLSSLQTLEPGAYPGFSPLSPPEQTTPVQPRNPELEQRAKAMRGRMWVHQHSGSPSSVRAAALPAAATAVSSAVVKNATFFPLRFVLNELIQTEKDYVKDLGIVVEVSHQHVHAYTVSQLSVLFRRCDRMRWIFFSIMKHLLHRTSESFVCLLSRPHNSFPGPRAVPLLDCRWKHRQLIGFMADNFHLSFQTIL